MKEKKKIMEVKKVVEEQKIWNKEKKQLSQRKKLENWFLLDLISGSMFLGKVSERMACQS